MLVKVHSRWSGPVFTACLWSGPVFSACSLSFVRSSLQRVNGPVRFTTFGWSGPSDNKRLVGVSSFSPSPLPGRFQIYTNEPHQIFSDRINRAHVIALFFFPLIKHLLFILCGTCFVFFSQICTGDSVLLTLYAGK